MLSWFGHNSKCWIKVLSWNTICICDTQWSLLQKQKLPVWVCHKEKQISIFTTAARLYSQMNIKCWIIQLEIQPNILRDIPLLYSTKPSPSVNTLAECRTKKRRDTLSFNFWEIYWLALIFNLKLQDILTLIFNLKLKFGVSRYIYHIFKNYVSQPKNLQRL